MLTDFPDLGRPHNEKAVIAGQLDGAGPYSRTILSAGSYGALFWCAAKIRRIAAYASYRLRRVQNSRRDPRANCRRHITRTVPARSDNSPCRHESQVPRLSPATSHRGSRAVAAAL